MVVVCSSTVINLLCVCQVWTITSELNEKELSCCKTVQFNFKKVTFEKSKVNLSHISRKNRKRSRSQTEKMLLFRLEINATT